MTENDYFEALRNLLDSKLVVAATAVGGHYEIKEVNQNPFVISTRKLDTHLVFSLERLKSDWLCFRTQHPFAHKRCDRVLVTWDRALNCPKYLLVELKSTKSNTAHKQLGASLAFCHFAHRMVCVSQNPAPEAKFAAVTVKTLPFALKNISSSPIPSWNTQPLQSDCSHMQFNRSSGELPVHAILATI